MKNNQTQKKIKDSLQDQNCPVLKLKIQKKESLPPVPDSDLSEKPTSKPVSDTLNAEEKKTQGPKIKEAKNEEPQIKSSRKDLQIPRRIFHICGGISIALLYGLFLSHSSAVHILGLFACLFYIFEQIRINYPEYSAKLNPASKYFMRAEEQLKESAMIPYMVGILLTIISFPKSVAICSILTLGMADPLSAIVGIKFGKHQWVEEKTIEGSLAFFLSCFFCILFPLLLGSNNPTTSVFIVSLLTSLMVSSFEMLPIKIDDNLTIPIFTAICLWINGSAMGILFF